ncbi:hypothetical protein ABZ949_02045 [Micromonospora tulbaghiae]
MANVSKLAADWKAAQNVQKQVGGREAARQVEAARQALAAATKGKR